MATEPNCSMTVDEATTLNAEYDGQTFYFYSKHCREKFFRMSCLGLDRFAD